MRGPSPSSLEKGKRKGRRMRRAVVLLVVAAAALLLAAGAVWALDRTCGGGDCVGDRLDDTITGSTIKDRIAAMEGDDTIVGSGGSDEIYGDEGNDTINDASSTGTNHEDNDLIYGDEGNDVIDVREGNFFADLVFCGPGRKDKVFFDVGSDIVRGCEQKNPGQ
jgi:Ca2+-binding RTX toxin-like protein